MPNQVRGLFPQLYDNRDKTIFAIMMDQLREVPSVHRRYYNVKTSQKSFDEFLSMAPFQDVPEKPEGQVFATDVMQPAWTKRFVHLEFGLGFVVTRTALEDDQYDVLAQNAKWLAFSARTVQEQRAAMVLELGFTTELSPDGQPVFATAHPLKRGGTASNTLAVAADLTVQSLEELLSIVQTETRIESGQLVAPVQSYYLVVHPANEFNAHRILFSAGMPGTADNDVNAVKNRRRIELVVNQYLEDPDAWYLIPQEKRSHKLITYDRKPITVLPRMEDPDTRNYIYHVRFRKSWGVAAWQGLAASPGA